jgi:hypothetical protein
MRIDPKTLAVCAAIAAASLVAEPAHARGPYYGWRGGVVVGVPLYRPWYPGPWAYGGYYPGAWGYGGYYGGYYGPYAVPPAVYAPPAPTVFIERADAVAQAPAAGFWYWCADSRAYYPSVPACASAWVPVPPRAN